MQSRPRILPSLIAAFFLAGVMSQAASCTLDQQGLTAAVQTQACNADANCDDKDQCTVNLCGANRACEFQPVNGLAPEQKAGDCQQGSCADGVLTQIDDDSDLPDDLESCTVDSCANGLAVHETLPDDSPCSFGDAAGLCMAGKCTVECGPQKPCNDGNSCTEDTCNASTGACSFAALDGLPTPGFTPVVGDCSQQICVNGVSTTIADDADLPNDDNTCTKDGCTNGLPVQTPMNGGAPCIMPLGGTGVCDNGGKCIGCNALEDCPAIVPANPCKQRTCTNNVCGIMDLVGVDVPSTSGDCRKTTCDGTGTPVDQIDNSDVPKDGNLCTKDVCTTGMPSNPPENMGFSCGGMLTCDGAGQCTGCDTAADCGMSDECKTYTCVSKNCQISYAAGGTPVSMGQTPGDCKIKACDGAGNTISAIDAFDIPNDMNDCTLDSCDAMGIPSNVLKALNAPCADMGGTVCNGLGMCLRASGTNCLDGGECVTGFCTDGYCCTGTCTSECMACNVPMNLGACTNVPSNTDDAPLCTGTNSCDGMGACKRDNGQPCGMNGECSSGFCADGVCCTSACSETCKSCNLMGTVGTCTLVPNDTVDPTGMSPCNNPYRCDGTGLCKGLNSVACSVSTDCLSGYCADGFCCGNICNQLCMACAGTLTGVANGSCKPILNGTDPQNECPNGECNGLGVCTGGGGGMQANGSPCSGPGQCSSGFCIDNVCCGTACTESCKTCNLMGQVGSCVNVPNDIIDPTGTTPCQSPYRCDGAGVCKALNSVPCMMASQCLSGNCVDGFCCNNACGELCRSCSSALNAGADGTCGFTKAGSETNNECAVGACNGAGMCTP